MSLQTALGLLTRAVGRVALGCAPLTGAACRCAGYGRSSVERARCSDRKHRLSASGGAPPGDLASCSARPGRWRGVCVCCHMRGAHGLGWRKGHGYRPKAAGVWLCCARLRNGDPCRFRAKYASMSEGLVCGHHARDAYGVSLLR
jgi:hypothetical protein